MTWDFTKRLISPAANLVTDALHIPGGVGTSFSLMFLVVAAVVIGENGCAAIMGAVQSVIALSLGMVGSMGMLSAVGYILPGVLIDLLLLALKHTTLPMKERMVCVNAAAAVCASLTANVIVFRLGGAALLLYLRHDRHPLRLAGSGNCSKTGPCVGQCRRLWGKVEGECDMKKNRTVLLAVVVLASATVLVAAVHLTGRISPAEGALYIEKDGRSTELSISDLAMEPVQGTVVNGRGESRAIDGQGVLLSALLERAEMRADVQITVTADDEYSAVVTAEELAASDKAYLIAQEEGGVQLVVFGDADSRRNVSNVVRVTVE